MEPEGLGKGKTDINEESGYVGKDRNIPEEVILAKKKKTTLKELSVIFHIIESMKDKMSEADPNLERSMIIC